MVVVPGMVVAPNIVIEEAEDHLILRFGSKKILSLIGIQTPRINPVNEKASTKKKKQFVKKVKDNAKFYF